MSEPHVADRRRQIRLPVQCAASCRDGVITWEGITIDLSPGGCLVNGHSGLKSGRTIEISLSHPAAKVRLRVMGTVKRCSGAGESVIAGISFKLDSPMDYTTANTFFEQAASADPNAALAIKRTPTWLPASATVKVAPTPKGARPLTDLEQAILRRVGAGVTVANLADQMGPTFEARLPIFFALFTSGHLQTANAPKGRPPASSQPYRVAAVKDAGGGLKGILSGLKKKFARGDDD